MTNGAASGEGAPITGAPRPNSCEAVAADFVRSWIDMAPNDWRSNQLIKALAMFAFTQRIEGAAKEAGTFDAILTETVTQLELVSIDLNLREYQRAGDTLRKHLDHLRSLRTDDGDE